MPPAPPLEFRAPDGTRLLGEAWDPPAGVEAPSRVVFLPGNGFPVQTYAPAWEAALATRPGAAPAAGGQAATPRPAVHALNPRGLGGSDAPDPEQGLHPWQAAADDLEAYLRERADGPALLAGHSFGAMVALAVAARSPQLASGLLLLDPLVLLPPGRPWPVPGEGPEGALAERARNRRSHWPSREEACETLRGRGIYATWDEAAFGRYVEAGLVAAPEGGVRLGCPPWLEAGVFMTRPGPEVFEQAEAVRCPVCIVRGRESRAHDARAVEALAGRMRQATVMVVPGAHTFPMERPTAASRGLAVALRLLLVGGGED